MVILLIIIIIIIKLYSVTDTAYKLKKNDVTLLINLFILVVFLDNLVHPCLYVDYHTSGKE